MDILELMRTRFTSKVYDTSRRVSDDDIQALLEVCRLAPSSLNAQPWHFFLIDTPQAMKKAQACSGEFNAERFSASHLIAFAVPENIDSNFTDAIYECERNAGRFEGLSLTSRPDTWRAQALLQIASDSQKWYQYASNQVYLALGCVTLAAASKGIHSTIIGGFDPEKFDEVFGLKQKGLRSVVLLCLGYGADNDTNARLNKARLSADQVTSRLE